MDGVPFPRRAISFSEGAIGTSLVKMHVFRKMVRKVYQ
jgi:hypothetical protein